MDDNKQDQGAEAQAMVTRWVCDCGCTTFELIKGEAPICANCYMPVTPADGGWLSIEGTDVTVKAEDTFRSIGGSEPVSFVKERLRRRIKDDDAAMVIVGFASGEVSCWTEAETKEQIEWAASRLLVAEGLLDAMKRGAK